MPPLVTLEQVMSCPRLPSLPAVAMEVISLTSDANVRVAEIARVVQHDQALSAKILKTVNSSYYGLTRPCPSISRALTYLGLSTVKSLVLGFSLVDCTRNAGDGLDLIDYWRRSIYSAAAARRVATLSRACDPDEAFIAALMQDLGMPAIQATLGGDYQTLVQQTGGDHDQLPACEMLALGFTHGEAGTHLGERWCLPGSIVDAIRRHHQPDAPTAYLPIVHSVALGYAAAKSLSVDNPIAALDQFRRQAAEWFGFRGKTVTSLLTDIAEDAKELTRQFQLNIGKSPDVNGILARAEDALLQHQHAVEQEAQRLRKFNAQLLQCAMTDALTGAANRGRFDQELASQFTLAHTHTQPLGLLMIDADNFKAINDTHGHAAGDAVLIQLVERLMRNIGNAGIVCRYGGEEFAVLLPGLDRRDVARIAEAVRLAVAETPFSISASPLAADSIPITISIGAAILEPATAHRFTSPGSLVHAADKAVYAAKHAGRNCVRVFSIRDPAKAA